MWKFQCGHLLIFTSSVKCHPGNLPTGAFTWKACSRWPHNVRWDGTVLLYSTWQPSPTVPSCVEPIRLFVHRIVGHRLEQFEVFPKIKSLLTCSGFLLSIWDLPTSHCHSSRLWAQPSFSLCAHFDQDVILPFSLCTHKSPHPVNQAANLDYNSRGQRTAESLMESTSCGEVHRKARKEATILPPTPHKLGPHWKFRNNVLGGLLRLKSNLNKHIIKGKIHSSGADSPWWSSVHIYHAVMLKRNSNSQQSYISGMTAVMRPIPRQNYLLTPSRFIDPAVWVDH